MKFIYSRFDDTVTHLKQKKKKMFTRISIY